MVFLLGGHDLEMDTIKEILQRHNVDCVDNGLGWSDARLSSYKDVLEIHENTDCIVYGVELELDMESVPKNFRLIDHHNENADQLSALEQVAKILGHELTFDEKLVAANDKGYFPAMKSLLDSSDDWKDKAEKDKLDKMRQVRKLDRDAQGVTEEEENFAKNVAYKEFGDLKIVEAGIEHFSPICDRFWPYENRLVIYNKSELCYYGCDAKGLYNSVCDVFFKDDSASKTYRGGGRDGFWGIKKGSAEPGIIDKVLEFLKAPASCHIFYFPFLWKNKESVSRIVGFEQLEATLPKDSGWRKGIVDNDDERYSLYDELNYYFPFAHKEMYECSSEMQALCSPSLFKDSEHEIWGKEQRVQHFERSEKGMVYELVVKAGPSEWRKYELDVEAINLNMYSIGVGLLSIYTKNCRGLKKVSADPEDWKNAVVSGIDKDDVLRINQFGRRVMPPFYNDIKGRSEIAQSMKLTGLKSGDIVEDFKDYSDEPRAWYYSNIIARLLVDFNSEISYRMAIDDRMFVMSWYRNTRCVESAVSEVRGLPVSDSGYSNFWYKYLFIDVSSPTCQDNKMRNELLGNHTYPRWLDWNSLYGITRYSFMYLTSYGAPQHLLTCFETIYARMAELVIMQKAAVLKFTDDIVAASSLPAADNKERFQNVQKIYKEYIRFKNQFYFREVTAQDQGVELYDMLQKSFGMEALIRDLDEDIQELYQYISIIGERESNENASVLNMILGIFTPASFIIAIWTSNGVDDKCHMAGISLLVGTICLTLIFIIGHGPKSLKVKVVGFFKRMWAFFARVINSLK